MRLLLDTCTFLWAALDDPKLSADARELLLDPESERLVAASGSPTLGSTEVTSSKGGARRGCPGEPIEARRGEFSAAVVLAGANFA
jgi:hypothetical protein